MSQGHLVVMINYRQKAAFTFSPHSPEQFIFSTPAQKGAHHKRFRHCHYTLLEATEQLHVKQSKAHILKDHKYVETKEVSNSIC